MPLSLNGAGIQAYVFSVGQEEAFKCPTESRSNHVKQFWRVWETQWVMIMKQDSCTEELEEEGVEDTITQHTNT